MCSALTTATSTLEKIPLGWATEHDIERRFGPRTAASVETTFDWATGHDIQRRFNPHTQAQRVRSDAAPSAGMPLGWATEHDIERRFGPRMRTVHGADTAVSAEMPLGWATEHDIERRFTPRTQAQPVSEGALASLAASPAAARFARRLNLLARLTRLVRLAFQHFSAGATEWMGFDLTVSFSHPLSFSFTFTFTFRQRNQCKRERWDRILAQVTFFNEVPCPPALRFTISWRTGGL